MQTQCLRSLSPQVKYGDQGVEVTTAAGEVITGSLAILTVPLGVLKVRPGVESPAHLPRISVCFR